MPTVKNTSYGVLTIALRSRTISLKPGESVSLSDRELQAEEVQKHLRNKLIVVMPDKPKKEPKEYS
jgi:hypothetical protein